MNDFIHDHLDLWTTTIKRKSSAGRGTSSKYELYGIKKLRELILELAVRGLLVPQDPTDEPASVLLKRIAAEKARWVKEGVIKQQKALPPIAEEEKPFELPEGWEWTHIAEIGHDWGQKTPDGNFTYIDVGSINNGLGAIENPSIISAKDAPSRARKLVRKGTVIYSTVRPYLLNIAVIQSDFEPAPIASTAFAIIHPLNGVSGDFVYYYLRSPIFVSYVERVQTGIAYPAINDKQFFSGLFPLPPVQEQHRIVAKVNELMTLCDQLEQHTEANISTHQTLVETLLSTITSTDSAAAIPLLLANFDSLFTTEHSIDQLKQTILQLAVMGKLVPQDPTDEPASVLLKKIAAEKAKLLKEGKIKKQKALPPITEEEKPFGLPEGWAWCRLQELVTLLGDGLHGTPDYDESGEYFFVNGNNLQDGVIKIKPETKRVSKLEYEKHKKDLHNKTVLVSINGTLGNVAFYTNEPVMLGKSACYFNLSTELSKVFIKRLIESPYFLSYAFAKSTGSTIKNLGLKAMNDFPFPLPPLAEQHRIVTKVNELLTLCDQLKTQLNHAQQTQLHLTDALTGMEGKAA